VASSFPLLSAVALGTRGPPHQGATSRLYVGTRALATAGGDHPGETRIVTHVAVVVVTAGVVAVAVAHSVPGGMTGRLPLAATQVPAGMMGPHLPQHPQQRSLSRHLHLASLCRLTCATGSRRPDGCFIAQQSQQLCANL
jgi:hypothetical protein